MKTEAINDSDRMQIQALAKRIEEISANIDKMISYANKNANEKGAHREMIRDAARILQKHSTQLRCLTL